MVKGEIGSQLVSITFTFPKAAPTSSHIPVGEAVDKFLNPSPCPGRVIAIHCLGDFENKLVQFGYNPSIEFGAILRKFGFTGVEVVDVSIDDKEGIGIP